MAYVNVPEGPYTANLIDAKSLNASSFNPRDYLDFSIRIKVNAEPLSKVADIEGEVTNEESARRVKSDGVDRATGQVYEQTEISEEVSCTKFMSGDILFHKYRARIGRIGIAEFDGFADSHFMVIRPNNINNYYLLLALRSVPVLIQLPFRETTRPGVWNNDIRRLRIPRLDTITEQEIGAFLKRTFMLRRRAKRVLDNLIQNFDMGVSSRMPTNNYFPLETSELTERTFDPGFYFMKVLEWTFPRNSELGVAFTVIQPPSTNSGAKFATMTIKDYEFEGIKPLTPKKVDKLPHKNFAREGDVILNKLHSKEKTIAKATVVGQNTAYLREVGLSVQEFNGKSYVPVYSELFIIRRKQGNGLELSPYYLAVMLNSRLFRRMFTFIMSGSTGRQRIRKEKLVKVKVPLLPDYIMKAISEATRICLDVFAETLRLLIQLSGIYGKVIQGQEIEEGLGQYIRNETVTLEELEGNSIEQAEIEALRTVGLSYVIE